MLKQIKHFWTWRHLAWALTIYSIRSEKRSNMLGELWHVINPIIQMCIFYFMVEIVFRRSIEGFPLFFLCGFMVYQFITKAISAGPALFVVNAGMIKTSAFPRIVVVGPVVFRGLYEMGIQLMLLIGLMWLFGVWPNEHLFYFPFFMMVTILGSVGVVMLLSVLGARVRDLTNITQHVNRLLFYLSPVMYSASFIPERFRDVYFMNPVSISVEISRYCLIGEDGVAFWQAAYYSTVCVSLFVIGLYFFTKHEWQVSKYV
ncbi:MAG: hypothetical protein D6694_00625 [Gammaproteobacteria bacterium]|nr:MAG: hypothetical protein D6694_00625 [Gammaproteobacteria bacterium]